MFPQFNTRHLGVRVVIVICLLAILLTTLSQIAPTAFAHPRKNPNADAQQLNNLGLISFDATVIKSKYVLATWETGSENTIMGFNLWRRSKNGQLKQLNPDLLYAQNPGEITGNTYKFRDRDVRKGRTYCYTLEVLGNDGTSAWTDEVCLTLPA